MQFDKLSLIKISTGCMQARKYVLDFEPLKNKNYESFFECKEEEESIRARKKI